MSQSSAGGHSWQTVTLYLAIPLLVLIAVVQASVISHLMVGGVHADLPLLVVVSWGLLQGPREGILWGFLAGVAVDLVSGTLFGAATLPLMLAGFVAGLGKGSIFAVQWVFPAVMMFLCTLIYDLLFLAVLWFSGSAVVWVDSLVRMVLPSALLNGVLMLPVFGLMRLAHTRFVRTEMEW